MKKIQMQTYTCLTFCELEIRELIQLFQTHLQDVEIIIDGLHITDIAQLERFEQFDPPYQATFLLARGYTPPIVENAPRQEDHCLIELEMKNNAAFLLVKDTASEDNPEVLVYIRALLLRHLNHNIQSLTLWKVMLTVIPSVTLVVIVAEQHMHIVSVLQLSLSIGVSILLIPVTLLLNIIIVRFLKMETTIFLLPGTMRVTRVYGWKEAIGRLLVALVLSIAICVSIFFVLHLLLG